MKAIIKVPDPCSEDWDTMEPRAGGRYCHVCAQIVVDFTHWELQDIAAYLKARRQQRTCGRFLKTQLDQPFDLQVFVPDVIRWQTESLRQMAALIVVLFAVATSSCNHPLPSHTTDTLQPQPAYPAGIVLAPVTDTVATTDTLPVKKPKARHKPGMEEVIGPTYETKMGGVLVWPEDPVPYYPAKDTGAFQPRIGPPEDTAAMHPGK